MQIKLPEEVIKIIETLSNAGFEAYAVGGCVRDSILGRKPDDWDITTSAAPQAVQKLFRRTIPTGIEHGTVTVRENGRNFEVTTFRIDGRYSDGRHPDSICFASSLKEDLSRRDFTVNAMAYNPDKGLVDLFNGQEHLKEGIICAVGVPAERFGEDALRMLRALRFAAQLSFRIEDKTAAAIRELAGNLKKISAERIRTELEKLLLSDHPEFLEEACSLGVTGVILPEFDICMETMQTNPYHAMTVGKHLIETVKAIRSDRVLRITMLLHDIAKPQSRTVDPDGTDHYHGHVELGMEMADRILKRLKYDNDTRLTVLKLIELHDEPLRENPPDIRRMIVRAGEDVFPLLLEVKEADYMGKAEETRDAGLAAISRIREMYGSILDAGDCLSLKDLAVTGKDLMERGVKQGRELGDILEQMLSDVLDEPSHNCKEYLLEHYLP